MKQSKVNNDNLLIPTQNHRASTASINKSFRDRAAEDKNMSIVQEEITATILGDQAKIDEKQEHEAKKKALFKELKPLVMIRSQIKMYYFNKALLENLTIMLIWFSCIYKQNIVSMVLFAVLVIYSYHRSGTTLLLVRSTVVILIVIQYWVDLIDLSSYNSPKRFPSELTGDQKVYPNEDTFFYEVPYVFSRNATRNETGFITNSTVNLNYTTYFMLDLENRKMNGLWIDFAVTVLVAVYFNTCSFWLLFRPNKIVMSRKTEQKLLEYHNHVSDDERQRTPKQILKDIKVQISLSQITKVWGESIFTFFPMFMIAFTLAVSIFN